MDSISKAYNKFPTFIELQEIWKNQSVNLFRNISITKTSVLKIAGGCLIGFAFYYCGLVKVFEWVYLKH